MTREKLLVSDTHPIIYFFCDGGKRLSKKADEHLKKPRQMLKQEFLYRHQYFGKLSLLVQNGDIEIGKPFSEWIDELFQYRTINPLAFDETTVKIFHDLRYHADPFDRAIVASAIQIGLPLITNDRMMHRHTPCELFWGY